jgi:hypothetical protein
MLKEIIDIRQISGEPRRRWFTDNYFDLYVWFGEDKDIQGFQLCYDKDMNQRALTWNKPSIYTHHKVDDGEVNPLQPKRTPILVADGMFDNISVAERFRRESMSMEGDVSKFVYEKLVGYGNKQTIHL